MGIAGAGIVPGTAGMLRLVETVVLPGDKGIRGKA